MSSQGTSGNSVGWPITRRPGRDRGIKSKGNDEDPEGPSSNGRVGYSRAECMGSRSYQTKDGKGSFGECPDQAKSGSSVRPLVIIVGS